MAKLIFIVVLALFALQGSDAHLKKVQPREAFESNVQEVIAELKKLIHDSTYRFSEVYAEVKDKVAEIEDQANFPDLLVDFKQQVEQLMAQDGADVCDTVTRQQVREVQELAAVFSCNIEVNEELTGLKKQLEVLTSKVGSLLKEFGRDVFKCMKESHGNQDKFNQCLEQNIFNVKQQVQVVEKEVEETFNVIEQSIPVFTDKFSGCVADKREKLVAKIEEAEETIKSCVSGNNAVTQVQRKESFQNNVQEFIAELKKLIHDTTYRFTKVYAEVKDNVAEIEDQANFPGLLVDFKQQVEQLMAQDGADVCDTVTRQQVREVQKLAAVFSCNIEVNEELTGLKKQLELLTSKVGTLLQEFGRDVFKCMKESHGNQDKFNQCLEQNIFNVKQQIQVVEKEIEETFNVIEQSIPVFTDKFSGCVADKREKLVAKIEEAEETIKSCVSGNNAVTQVQRKESFQNNVQEFIAELKKLIHDTTYRFTKVYAEVKDNVAEIEDQANFPGLLVDFKQQVEQLMAQDGADVCDTVTRQQVREVQKLAAVFSCNIEVNEELTGLKKQLELLTSKVGTLLQEFGRDVFKCMKESHGNQDKFNQCLEQNIFNVKQQIQVVEKEIEETFNVIEQSIPVFTDKFSGCVADKREKLVAKIEEAEETIKSCVSGNNAVTQVQRKESFQNNVQEFIAELKKLIHDTTYRFTKVYAEVKDNVAEIEDQANFPGLLVDFKQQVEQLMAQDGADVCDTVTRQQVREVQKLAAVFSCNIEVNEELTGLKKQLELLTSKVGSLLQEIGRDVFKCMKESHGNQDKFNQCMEQNIFNAKQQIQVVEKEIEETFNVVEQSIPVFNDKFSACVADKREKLVAKIEEAEEIIKSCVNGNNDVAPVSFKKSGFAHVADYFTYLSDEINEETAHVTVHLPEGVMSLADKINEIVSKHNIEALVEGARATVDKLLSEEEKDERLCGPNAHEQLDSVAKAAQVDVEGCVSQTQQVADSLEAKLAVLADESRALADKLNDKILACLKDNSVDFMRCMEESTDELRDEVAQLQKEVRETLEYAVLTVEDSLKDLDVCLVKVEDYTTEQTKAVVDALNTCINHADLLF